MTPRIVRLAGLPGDGIGPEVYRFVPRLFNAANGMLTGRGLQFRIDALPYNADYFLEHGMAWPPGTPEQLARDYDGAILIALGDSRVPKNGMAHAVEIILNGLRGHPAWLTNFNCRPVRLLHPCLRPAIQTGPFSFELFTPPTDGIEIREQAVAPLTSQEIIFPEEHHSESQFWKTVWEAVARAKALGQQKIIVVHKANVFEYSHGYWAQRCREIAALGKIEIELQLFDSFLERLVKDPQGVPQIIVTDRAFGSVLQRTLPALVVGERAEIPPDFHLTIGRENTEGMYFRRGGSRMTSFDSIYIQKGKHSYRMVEANIRECVRLAKEQGKSSITLLHLDDVHPTSYGLWKRIASRVATEAGLSVVEMHAGDFVAALIRNPGEVNGRIIAADNVLGDICGDAAAALTGGLGFPATASSNTDGTTNRVYFEPLHGSAPTLAGLDRANPSATFLTVGMALAHFGAPDLETLIQQALFQIIDGGLRTFDMPGGDTGTTAFGEAVLARFTHLARGED